MSLLNLLDRPISFQRSFVRLGVGITGALLLSQAVYWHNRTNDPDGWFYKTYEEWEEETGLSRRELDTARRNLKAKGYLQEKKKGVPCKIHYRVVLDVLEKDLLSLDKPVQTSMAESAKLDCTNAPNSDGGKRQTITEITTETTTKPKSESADSSEPNDSVSDIGNCPQQQIIEVWNQVIPEKPFDPQLWDKTSQTHLRSRWQAASRLEKGGERFYTTQSEGVDWWRRFFEFIRKSEFLMSDEAMWFGLDWVVKAKSFKSIMSLKYHQRSAA